MTQSHVLFILTLSIIFAIWTLSAAVVAEGDGDDDERRQETQDRPPYADKYSSHPSQHMSNKDPLGAQQQQQAASGRSSSKVQNPKPHENDGVSHPIRVAMQNSSPPGVHFNHPNLLLPSSITHVVEFELVKAWRSQLIERQEDGSGKGDKTSSDSTININHNRNNIHHHQHQHHPNVTTWEVIGTVLVALFGEAEPELVASFLSATRHAYSNRNMSRGFDNIHPVRSLSPKKQQQQQQQGNNHRLFPGNFVNAKALPKELRDGLFLFSEEEQEDMDRAHAKMVDQKEEVATVRPPWAERGDSRWVCSSVYPKSTAAFTFFNAEKKAMEDQQKKKMKERRAAGKKNDEEEDERRPAGRHPHHPQQQQVIFDSQDQDAKKRLMLRAGAVVHRNCLKRRSGGGGNDSGAKNTKSNSGDDVFTWYTLGHRSTSQVLHTRELFQQIQNEDDAWGMKVETPEDKKKLVEDLTRLHNTCEGDRVFGQVISGFPHIQRLVHLPSHRSLFARDHFFNNSKTRFSSSPSTSSSSSVVTDDVSDGFVDDHDEEVFSPLVEGVPMQHVSISRASVYKWRAPSSSDDDDDCGIDGFLKDRRTRPHAAPPPEVASLLKQATSSNNKNKNGGGGDDGGATAAAMRMSVDEKLKELDAVKTEAWARYSFGRSVSPFDLEADVRFARADFTLECSRERQDALREFRNLDASGKFSHLLELLLLMRAQKNDSSSSSSSSSSSFFDLVEDKNTFFEKFVRFTGGVQPGPNVTFANEVWVWTNKHFPALVQTALKKRLARDPEMQRDVSEERREKISSRKGKTRQKGDDGKKEEEGRRMADAFAALSPPDHHRVNVNQQQQPTQNRKNGDEKEHIVVHDKAKVKQRTLSKEEVTRLKMEREQKRAERRRKADKNNKKSPHLLERLAEEMERSESLQKEKTMTPGGGAE